MIYTTPKHRREPVKRVLETLTAARSVVMTTHLNADGDGAGSEVAIASWLRALGCEAWIINPTRFPDMYRFLLRDESWVLSAGSKAAAQRCRSADVALVLDTGEGHRIGRVKELFDPLPKVVIDHHPPGDQPIAGISLRDPMASATGEIVYDLLLASKGPWTPEAIRGMYVAILTDTGGFRFSNATPACHRVVSDLIERGVDPEDLYRRVYGAGPIRRFRLLSATLDTLEMDEHGRVAWMTVPQDAYEQWAQGPEDLEGLVDYPRSIQGVEVGLLFRRMSSGGTKISFRSNGPVDVNALARHFGGGGHVKASGGAVERPVDEVRALVVEATLAAVQAELGVAPSEEGHDS